MEKSAVKTLQTAALFGAAAVILGAFGAHGLKPHLTDYQVTIYEKGVHYHFFHTLALGLVALLQDRVRGNNLLKYAAWAFVAGICCFSGSLYLLACRDMLSFPVGWAGPVTPLGGLGFIAGWVLIWAGVRRG